MHNILIVDGTNLAHRCRHTFDLSFRGLDVSVTYGFLRTLYSVMREHVPVVVVVCWDGGAPPHRYEHTPSYKFHTHDEDPTWPDFITQMEELNDILPILGVISVRHRGCEADDLAYQSTLLLSGHKSILTTDQDLYQAIKDDVDVISPVKEMIITNGGFAEVVGVPRSAYLVYKAMVGDSSDGIPGIKGIGEKTAAKLINKYGSNRSDILRAAEVDPNMPAHLKEKIIGYGKEGFFHAMMTIRLDMDLCGARHALLKAFNVWESYDHSMCKQFLQMYALVSLMEPAFYNAFRRLIDPKTTLSDISKLRLPEVTKLPRHPVG